MSAALRPVHREKDSTVTVEIGKRRLSAIRSLLERRDVIVVASVSGIYRLGSTDDPLTGDALTDLDAVTI